MDGKLVILRLLSINGCLKFPATSLIRSLLIVGKNSLIGNLFRMRMTLIFSLRIQNALVKEGLNEHSNGLLRRNGLPKRMDFANISQNDLSAISDKRNRIPRRSLNYHTDTKFF